MQPISKTQFISFLLMVGSVFFFCLRGDHWFPLVDNANLAFHEFGHPFFGAMSQRLMVYGGTIAQLCFPVITAVYFYKKRETFSFAVGFLWIIENLLNISTYMRDARAHDLPLVGNGEHDWTEIFARWNCLESDIKISNHLIKIIILSVLGFTYWLYHKMQKSTD